MYNKCYNAKFQVQDDEQQLNGKRVPIHLAGSYSFLFLWFYKCAVEVHCRAFDQLMETMPLSSALWHRGLPAAKSGITAGDRAP